MDKAHRSDYKGIEKGEIKWPRLLRLAEFD
jgi:hypothetical protein